MDFIRKQAKGDDAEMSDVTLRVLRIEHDRINGKPIGSLSSSETNRLTDLRKRLAGTTFEPWGLNQTKEAYESIYGSGSWKD